MGGEYDGNIGFGNTVVDQNAGSIYDPATDKWTSQPGPSSWTTIGDAMGIVLANGTYMQSDCCSGKAAFLNPATLTWTSSTGVQIDNYNDEEGWVLLQDGTVLNVDLFATNPLQTSRYNPATDQWTSAGFTPAALGDNIVHTNGIARSYELGPGLLRPDGTVFWIGDVPDTTASAHTAVYNTATNTWSAGPDVPNNDGGNDAPASILPNGNVLAQLAPASATDNFGNSSRFYEFDGTNWRLTASPTNCTGNCDIPAWIGAMLVLPTGQVMLTERNGGPVEIYTSTGGANASWRPTITSVPASVSAQRTYTISGTQFNGLTAGAAYGDDVQSATNYPLVRITNRATGHVFYAKTHDHSTMGVATGSATVSTRFDVPAGIELGSSDIEVVANGIASAKTAISVNVKSTRGQSDFNGDSKADLIWYNAATGQTSTWLMNGGTQQSGALLLTDPNWKISTTADFNGDGNTDILWYDAATGTTAAWLMSGQTQTVGTTLLVDPNWKVTFTGDFNGDGKADLIWYNAATGMTSMWLMNGLSQSSGATLLTDPNWKVTATADFNGDGNSDLIWYNAATGMTAMWLMSGTVQASGATLLTDPNWKVTFTPDLNGDGKFDLIWYNAATGQTAYWVMNGTTQTNGGLLLTDPNWKATGTADLNGDSKADLIWYNALTGQTAYWLMNGGTQTNGGLLLTDPNWKATLTGQ